MKDQVSTKDNWNSRANEGINSQNANNQNWKQLDHAKTDVELFEKTSDENLILFYREEIKRIDEGEKAKDLLSIRVTRRLLDLGILVRTWQNALILGEKGKILKETFYKKWRTIPWSWF